MHFKIIVVFPFVLHIYLYLCKATNLYRLITIIFYGSKATFKVYLRKNIYIYIYIFFNEKAFIKYWLYFDSLQMFYGLI